MVPMPDWREDSEAEPAVHDRLGMGIVQLADGCGDVLGGLCDGRIRLLSDEPITLDIALDLACPAT